MKILVVNNPGGMGAFGYISQGFINAFTAAGHQAIRWDGKAESWHAFKPDLYLGCSGHPQQIPTNRGNTIIGIHVNPYGRTKVGSVDGGPVIDEPQNTISWTIKQKPNFVYCYCSDTFTDEYFGHYTSRHGLKVVGIPCAADLTVYKPVLVQPEYACEIGWVGGYWAYKAKMLDKYLTPLFPKYKCKVYGWGGWSGPAINKTNIADADVSKLFSSAKICPSVSESHSVTSPVDVPERVFKVPAGGGFTIHTPSPAISDFFGTSVPMAANPDEWFSLIKHYMDNDDLREYDKARQREVILQRHTYFDRMAGIAKAIKNKELEESLMAAKLRFIG